MTKLSQVFVLVEDSRQQSFLNRHLLRLKYRQHQITFEPMSDGKGSGEQWVREHYASVVEKCRQRNEGKRAATGAVVAIDADDKSVQDRNQELGRELQRAGLASRSVEEAIVHLIPKWSIETWVVNLAGNAVDEHRSYRQESGISKLLGAANEAFYAGTRLNAELPKQWVPSLLTAVPEAWRLEA